MDLNDLEFVALLGDCITIDSQNWLELIVSDFELICQTLKLDDSLYGFGCVAFNDAIAPHCPRYLVLHLRHIDLVGELYSPLMRGNNGAIFLYQLYRRFGACCFSQHVTIIDHEVPEEKLLVPCHNFRKDVSSWSESYFESIMALLANSLGEFPEPPTTFLSIDVIIPTFRVDRKYLENILNLKCNLPNTSVYYTVVVDNPTIDIDWLLSHAMHSNGYISIYRNETNMGPSYSRNVGIFESCAEWKLFLDDDVIPGSTLIDTYVAALRHDKPPPKGYVGYTQLPENPMSVYFTAVHFSEVCALWRVALTQRKTAWGITANLFAKRYPNIQFDTSHQCGGEDFDFCLQYKEPFSCAPNAIVVHPWWNRGKRDYYHFFKWAVGDGLLLVEYPQHTFATFPNSVEMFSMIFFLSFLFNSFIIGTMLCFLIALVDCIIAIDLVFFDSTKESYCNNPFIRFFASLESVFIRYAYDAGKIHGLIVRGQIQSFSHSLDWFCGWNPEKVTYERQLSLTRFLAHIVVVSGFLYLESLRKM